MNKHTPSGNSPFSKHHASAQLKRRHRKETRLKFYGLLSIIIAFAFLGVLLTRVVVTGVPAFKKTEMALTIYFPGNLIVNPLDVDAMEELDVDPLIQEALRREFPGVTDRAALLSLYQLTSRSAPLAVKDTLRRDPSLLGKAAQLWLPVNARVDGFRKGHKAEGLLSDTARGWINTLESKDKLRFSFNSTFFSRADSRMPEYAGFLGAIVGSIFTLAVCLGVAFPLGVFSALYLEEFAPKNTFTDAIEVNINNLAAVPSIIYGLLGLSLYLQFFGMPRSSPLVGGLTLALMVLPVIVITTRNALKSVPPSIRQAAMGMGASPIQVAFHHTLPLALPGIMTGTILSIARALGETAPLLMIGMVAFLADIPSGTQDSATVMPVQIYIWATSPEAAFVEKTSAGIMVLLGFLILCNAVAVWIRKKAEKTW